MLLGAYHDDGPGARAEVLIDMAQIEPRLDEPAYEPRKRSGQVS
jgi:hypothetical protein